MWQPRTLALACIAILLGGWLWQAKGQTPEPFVARGVFCETLDQAAAFLEAHDGQNLQQALTAANGDLPPAQACGTSRLIIVVEKEVATMENVQGNWQLVEIWALASVRDDGAMRPFPVPIRQYTAFLLEPAVRGTSI